jgi:hypothetical protein
VAIFRQDTGKWAIPGGMAIGTNPMPRTLLGAMAAKLGGQVGEEMLTDIFGSTKLELVELG